MVKHKIIENNAEILLKSCELKRCENNLSVLVKNVGKKMAAPLAVKNKTQLLQKTSFTTYKHKQMHNYLLLDY